MATGRNRTDTLLFLPALAALLQLTSSVTNGADSLAFGQYLSSNETLVSKQGVFELGFFRPGNSSKQYLGIWHKKVVKSQRAYVWVANRDKPISELHSASAFLNISDDGHTFAIFANASSTASIWSSSPSIPSGRLSSNSTRLLLLDTGNLVLVDGNYLDPSAFLWESFDHPTDTYLSGSKIGYNHTAGKSWAVTPWKSPDDPSPGSYTVQIDPSGARQFLLLWNGSSQPYWSSGVYRDHVFTNIPQLRGVQSYYGFIPSDSSDAAANYFTYVYNKPNEVAVLFVHSSGLIKNKQWFPGMAQWQDFIWFPGDRCQVPSYCGAYGLCLPTGACQCLPGFQPRSPAAWGADQDYTSGCVRKTQLNCGTSGSDSDGFLPLQAVISLPVGSKTNSTALPNNISTAGECEEACLRYCSCTAYYFNASGCQIWSGELMNVKQVQQEEGGRGAELSSPLQLRLASSELKAAAGSTGPSSNKKQHNKLVIGLSSGLLAILLLAVLLAWSSCYRRSYRETGPTARGFIKSYRYGDLQKATKNFSTILGKGGFGSVYRGTLPDDTPIAVKRLELGLQAGLQGEKQFRSEVRAMATVQHINILQIRGFCCEGPHRILVYDCMHNGSLDAHLFPASAVPIPWAQRYSVARGVARGLAYLHDDCLDRIVHCDIKPENILLDADMCPKLADFGMAKLIGRDFSRALTTMRGTVGYIAPEWINGTPITPKADVYSFGMMLFEIVFGRRNGEPPTEGCSGVWFFPVWAATNISQGQCVDLLDDLLQECERSLAVNGYEVDEFRRAWRLAWWCVQDSEEHRPTMAQVIQMLDGVLDLGIPPIPRHVRNQGEENGNMGNLNRYQMWRTLITPTFTNLIHVG